MSTTAVQRKAPIGRPAMSTKSAPVGKAGAAIKRAPMNGVKSTANGAAGSAGGAVNGVAQHLSPYEIMASRIANRVAEMAESYTFVERPKSAPAPPPEPVDQSKKKPRKLEIRLQNSGADAIAFSAPFLDNTLKKMLELQNKMLKVSAEIAAAEGVSEATKREQFAQTSELSRIIALICAEKARQGA